jgi:hypothetical protein
MEPEPVIEPVAPAAPAAPAAEEPFSRAPVPDTATEPRENGNGPSPAAEPELAAEPEPAAEREPVAEPEPEPVAAVAAVAAPEAVASPDGTAGGSGPARGMVVLAVLAGVAALLSFLAIRRPLYEGYGSVLDESFLADVGAWAPTVALAVGAVLVLRRPGVGCEWLIGAGAAFALVNYGGIVNFLAREGNAIDTAAMVERSVAALLAVVVVLLAWRDAEVPGPRISLVLGAVLGLGAVIAILGIRDYGGHADLAVLSWLIIALIALLLVRAFAFPSRTTGAPALVAGGVVGTLAGLESGTREHWETSVRSALIMATVGFAVIAIIGVIRWRQSTRPAVAAGTPSPAAA